MMRYLRYLQGKDIGLDKSMIPLGSCTMKLNAASQLMPVSWSEFASVHPFTPIHQVKGYEIMLNTLVDWLKLITKYDAFSLQPNSGAQGEYAGLLTIRGYHKSRGEAHRTVCLIPSSAHGTNPASAIMAGMQVVGVKTEKNGTVDLKDLREKAE